MKKVDKVIPGTMTACVKPQNRTSAGDYRCWNDWQIVDVGTQKDRAGKQAQMLQVIVDFATTI